MSRQLLQRARRLPRCLAGAPGLFGGGSGATRALCPLAHTTAPPSNPTRSFPSATNQPTIAVTFAVSDAGSGVANTTCRQRELAAAVPTPTEVDGPSADGSSDASSDASSGSGASTSGGGRANADWEACASGQAWGGLGEGRYGLTLRAFDTAGNLAQVGRGPLGWRASAAWQWCACLAWRRRLRGHPRSII